MAAGFGCFLLFVSDVAFLFACVCVVLAYVFCDYLFSAALFLLFRLCLWVVVLLSCLFYCFGLLCVLLVYFDLSLILLLLGC